MTAVTPATPEVPDEAVAAPPVPQSPAPAHEHVAALQTVHAELTRLAAAILHSGQDEDVAETGRTPGRADAPGAGLPAWRRVTAGESRWPVIVAVAAAVALQVVLPNRFSAGHRAVPLLELALVVGLWLAHPHKTGSAPRWMRPASVALIGMITATNAWSAVRLIAQIVNGQQDDPIALLSSGGAIWATNIILFALWYWEFDRGGPLARAQGRAPHPDFSFPQMQNPELAPGHWEPHFPDYLYVSFTNACSFSPTDTMPLSRWAKMAMLAQSSISLVVIALVIARAVGLFK